MFFSTALTFSLALAVIFPVSAIVVPRAGPPTGWLTEILEPYTTYHNRYLALNCHNQHGRPFFDACCHPLLAHQKLESRPKMCIPHSPTSSPVPSTSTAPYEGGGDCDNHSTVSTSVHLTKPLSTSTPVVTVTTAKTSTLPKSSSTPAPKVAAVNVNQGGFATFYYQNGNAGACGEKHDDGALIAAIDSRRYGNLNVRSPQCNKKVRITNTGNGKTVDVIIKDACPTCENTNSIDLSLGAFQKIATLSEGMVPIKWNFI